MTAKGTGGPINKSQWPSSGAVFEWLTYCEGLYEKAQRPSTQVIANSMYLKSRARVNNFLRGVDMPTNREQAEHLLGALGGTAPEIVEGKRLYDAAKPVHDDKRRSGRFIAEVPKGRRSIYFAQVARHCPTEFLGRREELD